MIEAMKQALEALQGSGYYDTTQQREAITAIKEAIREHAMYEVQRLGQEIEQEPDKYQIDIECTKCGAKQSGVLTVHTHPPQLEQNFCPRCGKRTNDIHTCTPPQEKNT